jgi:hypothetical protein
MQRGTDFSAAEGGVWAVPGAAFGQAAWGDRDGEDGGDRAAGSPAPTRTGDYACALCVSSCSLGKDAVAGLASGFRADVAASVSFAQTLLTLSLDP